MSQSKLEIVAPPNEPSIVTRRTVDAPRALVWECFTKHAYIKRWMGPRSMPIVSCESDLRVGGKWRFVHRGAEGREVAFYGEYREIDAPARLVRTFTFAPMPDHEAVETLELTEHDRGTLITTTTVHKSIAGRDGHLSNGAMETGMRDGYARLDELVAQVAAGGAAVAHG